MGGFLYPESNSSLIKQMFNAARHLISSFSQKYIDWFKQVSSNNWAPKLPKFWWFLSKCSHSYSHWSDTAFVCLFCASHVIFCSCELGVVYFGAIFHCVGIELDLGLVLYATKSWIQTIFQWYAIVWLRDGWGGRALAFRSRCFGLGSNPGRHECFVSIFVLAPAAKLITCTELRMMLRRLKRSLINNKMGENSNHILAITKLPIEFQCSTINIISLLHNISEIANFMNRHEWSQPYLGEN